MSESQQATIPRPSSAVKPTVTALHVGVGLAVIVLVFFVLNAMGVFNLSAANLDSEPADTEQVRRLPVAVRPAKKVDKVEQTRLYTGTIRAKQKANLGFELTGRVAQVLVDEGAVVDKDQVLATLDIKTLEARKSATVASLQQANAVLDELVAGPRQEKIDSMQAQVEEADSNLKLAEINLKTKPETSWPGGVGRRI